MPKTLHLTFSFDHVAGKSPRHFFRPFIFHDKFQSLKKFWLHASAELLAPREKVVDSLLCRIREEFSHS